MWFLVGVIRAAVADFAAPLGFGHQTAILQNGVFEAFFLGPPGALVASLVVAVAIVTDGSLRLLQFFLLLLLMFDELLSLKETVVLLDDRRLLLPAVILTLAATGTALLHGRSIYMST